MAYNELSFSELVGKTLKEASYDAYSERIRFETVDGDVYFLYHSQDCCESVAVHEIVGDLEDLAGYPILFAEESSKDGGSTWGEALWTFYKISTINGSVTISWFGESNGYYSVSVDFVKE